jgi:hypothetical protein
VGVAVVLFAVALCDLAILRLRFRGLHATFCVMALATAGTLVVFAQFFESRDAGGQGINVASVSWAPGSWIVLSGVLIGFLGIAVGAHRRWVSEKLNRCKARVRTPNPV